MSLTSYRAAPPRGKGLGSTNAPPIAWIGRRFGGPGSDLLFRALRRSTIGAEGFHGRVRDGIGCFAPRYGHQAGQTAPHYFGPIWEKASVTCDRCVFAEVVCRSGGFRFSDPCR